MIYRKLAVTIGQDISSDRGSWRSVARLSGFLVFVLFAALTNDVLARDQVPTEPSIVEVQHGIAAGRFTVRDLERHYEARAVRMCVRNRSRCQSRSPVAR